MSVVKGVLALVMAILLGSCYWDSVEGLNPKGLPDPCDTVQHAVYAESIQLIMAYQCLSCHDHQTAQGGVVLDTYAAVKFYGVNGKLLLSIQRQGSKPMPPAGAIPSCQTDKIILWINNQYPQ